MLYGEEKEIYHVTPRERGLSILKSALLFLSEAVDSRQGV